MKMRNAFTLAEVLITLGIIGIVAAMTLPSIIEKYQEKVTVSKVRKMYALLQEAYLRVENKYGPASSWDCPSSAGRNTSYTRLWTSYFVSEFANIKKCSKQKFYESCFNSDYYNLKGQRRWGISEEDTEFGYKLPDGGSFILLQNNSFLMHFYYDINGPKKPNMFGKDMFSFELYCGGNGNIKNKIMPQGYSSYSSGSTYFMNYCLGTIPEYCGTWVVYEGNMDYLHCNDLYKNGKTSCK